MRTRNPAVGSASASVSQYDQNVLRYIKYHRTQNGTSELTICQPLFSGFGNLYLASVAAQGAAATACSGIRTRRSFIAHSGLDIRRRCEFSRQGTSAGLRSAIGGRPRWQSRQETLPRSSRGVNGRFGPHRAASPFCRCCIWSITRRTPVTRETALRIGSPLNRVLQRAGERHVALLHRHIDFRLRGGAGPCQPLIDLLQEIPIRNLVFTEHSSIPVMRRVTTPRRNAAAFGRGIDQEWPHSVRGGGSPVHVYCTRSPSGSLSQLARWWSDLRISYCPWLESAVNAGLDLTSIGGRLPRHHHAMVKSGRTFSTSRMCCFSAYFAHKNRTVTKTGTIKSGRNSRPSKASTPTNQ